MAYPPALMAGRKVRALAGEDPCGALKKGGGVCERPAGYGTDHPGSGSCRLHGGNLPMHLRSKIVTTAELSLLAEEPVDNIDPAQALLWCVSLAAQEVRWINALLVKAAQGGATGFARPTTVKEGFRSVSVGDGISELIPTEETTHHPEEINLLVRSRQEAVDRLARYSKMALDAGVAERMVRLAEQMGDLIAPLLEGVLADLKLTPAQKKRAPAVVGRHLRALEEEQPHERPSPHPP